MAAARWYVVVVEQLRLAVVDWLSLDDLATRRVVGEQASGFLAAGLIR